MNVQDVESAFHCIISGIRHNGIFHVARKEEMLSNGDRIVCTIQKAEKERMINDIAKEAPIWIP